MQQAIRRLLLIVALGWPALASAPAHAHDVKDPVCRMTVDSDTAKWKHKLGNKSFYFCAKACKDKFAASPEKYEKLAGQLERGDLHEYTVELQTSPNPQAGQPVELAFTVKYKDSGKLVQEYEVIHERLFHLIMVTDDLRWFEHQHPARGADGVFRKTWTFPAPGKYTLYADFTPSDGDNQVIPLPLTVGGGPGKTAALSPDRRLVKQVRDLRVELKVQPSKLVMEKPAILTYTIKDRAGRPVRNMQPFIGAPGHLLAISQNRQEMVHTHSLHPTRADSMEPGAVRVTPQMATEKGPSFSFKFTAPTGGLYKTWAQFMHNNQVVTVPFTFYVEDLWAKKPAKPVAKAVALKCPVMEGPVANPKNAPKLVVNNKPVYFCCAGCDDELRKEPAKYLKQPVKDVVTGKSFRVNGSTPSVEHGGRLYLFISAASRDQFQRDPAKYAPMQ